MNAEAILALISDLYAQIRVLQAEVQRLQAEQAEQAPEPQARAVTDNSGTTV